MTNINIALVAFIILLLLLLLKEEIKLIVSLRKEKKKCRETLYRVSNIIALNQSEKTDRHIKCPCCKNVNIKFHIDLDFCYLVECDTCGVKFGDGEMFLNWVDTGKVSYDMKWSTKMAKEMYEQNGEWLHIFGKKGKTNET